jgi:hypothetical protein
MKQRSPIMADDSIHIEFDATLDEFVDVHMRQARRSREWPRAFATSSDRERWVNQARALSLPAPRLP